MNSGIVPREPKCYKNQVGDGGCRGANPCAALPQNCKTRCDQPDARDVGQYVLTRKIFDGLMRAIECTPGDIQNAGESSAQAIEPNPNFHLLTSHESLSEKPEPNDDTCALDFRTDSMAATVHRTEPFS